MSFQEIIEPGRAEKLADVSMSLTEGTSRLPRTLFLVIRRSAVPECAWLVPEAKVRLLRGAGADAHKLRIEPGGTTRVCKPSGRRVEGLVLIRSMMLAAVLPVRPGKFRSTQCDFEYDSGAIEIELPDWARPRATEPAPIPPPEPLLKAAKAPFKGVLSAGVPGTTPARAPIPLDGRRA
nr:hypothetical protein [uncultured Rhodopila sp.]